MLLLGSSHPLGFLKDPVDPNFLRVLLDISILMVARVWMGIFMKKEKPGSRMP